MKLTGWRGKRRRIPELSPERAEEILRNVFQAAGMEPPENCSEILRRGAKGNGSGNKEQDGGRG